MSLDGKVAIVTGAALGIGRATCDLFARRGSSVVIACRNEKNGRAAAAAVSAEGGKALFVKTDISEPNEVRRLVRRTLSVFGRVDVLVNNASSFIFRSLDASVRDWREVVGVNIIGTALCSRYAVDEMKKSGGGAIVNIASISAHIAQPNLLTYNTTKGALVEMTKCMALDLAPYNIRVNSVSPGYILTEHQIGKIEALNMTVEEAQTEWGALHILGRMGKPQEVAHAVVFLASEEASFITGTDLLVDGGYTAL